MTRPPLKELGTRWRFDTVHQMEAHRSGQLCEVVEHSYPWPYVVAFEDGKRMVALDRELLVVTP